MPISGLVLAARMLAVVPVDSAYLAGDTLRIEPVGLRVTVPSFWMGRVPPGATPLAPGGGRFGCQLMERSTVDERIVTDREQLATRERYRFGTKQAYDRALDSLAGSASLLAQLGGVPFARNCLAPQIRIYVADRATIDTAALGVVARREVERQYSAIKSVRTDSAGWSIERLSWTDSKTDFIHPGTLEVWYRVVGSRLIILAVMDAWSGKEDTAALLA